LIDIQVLMVKPTFLIHSHRLVIVILLLLLLLLLLVLLLLPLLLFLLLLPGIAASPAYRPLGRDTARVTAATGSLTASERNGSGVSSFDSLPRTLKPILIRSRVAAVVYAFVNREGVVSLARRRDRH
jgi:4-hydroxybenzoate polyprenyltransferase